MNRIPPAPAGIEDAAAAYVMEEPAFRQLFRYSSIGMATLDCDCRFRDANPALCQLLGYSRHELLDRNSEDFTHPDDRAADAHLVDRLRAGELENYRYEKRYLSRNGGVVHVLLDTVMFQDSRGQPAGFLTQVRDISDIRRLEQSLLDHEERWKLALKGGNHGVWDWNVKTNEAFFSPEWKRIIGYEDHELANRFEEWRDRIHPDDVERTLGDVRAYLDGLTSTYVNEHRLLGKDGIYRWILTRGELVSRDEHGLPLRFVGTHTDITWRKHTEASLRAQARHLSRQVMYDDLTGLPNRILLIDRLQQVLAYHNRDRRGCAFAILELRDLRDVNNHGGHAAGDAVLRAVASRLGQGAHGIVTVARYSSAQFAALLSNVSRSSAVKSILDETLESVAAPVAWQGKSYSCAVSCGVAISLADARDADGLVQCAQAALDVAIKAGNDLIFYDSTMEESVTGQDSTTPM